MCRGATEVQVNLQKKVLKKGDLLTILPQSIVRIYTKDIEGAFICILFYFEDISDLILPSDYNFLKTLLVRPIISLDNNSQKSYQDYFQLLSNNYNSAYSKFYGQIMKYLLFSLIGHINVFYQQDEHLLHSASRKDTTVFQFFNLAHQHYENERSVQFYADRLKLTPKYLSKLVRLRTGSSAAQVITALVMIKAKSYLSASDFPINQIAYLLNFVDVTTFCRYFKKYAQMTAGHYRELNR